VALAWLATLFAMQIGDDGDATRSAANGVRAGARSGAITANVASEPAAGGAYRLGEAPAKLRYDVEYPTVGYATAPRTDRVASLQARLARGEVTLRHTAPRGYLDSLLAALAIDPASQILVYSQTSLQSERIRPSAPRAIYFNDDTYVAWVQGGPIEIAAMDPVLGPVFYTLEQAPERTPPFEQELTRCLSCHDSYSLTGGGVPRFLTGSGYTGSRGELMAHEGWILVSDRTPLKSRWGGWYVTGTHGDQVHLGNMVIRSYSDFERLEELRVGNLDTLESRFDTSRYRTDKSDIVALLVFEHQTNMQNAITRLNYDTRNFLHSLEQNNGADIAAAEQAFGSAVEALVDRALFVGAIEFASPISGDEAFVEQFASRALRESEGRSLRDLDLSQRLFRYPLSFVVDTPAFAALPAVAKEAVYARLATILASPVSDTESDPFAHLSARDRNAVREILAATTPEFAAVAR
jgi:hypothetical protein